MNIEHFPCNHCGEIGYFRGIWAGDYPNKVFNNIDENILARIKGLAPGGSLVKQCYGFLPPFWFIYDLRELIDIVCLNCCQELSSDYHINICQERATQRQKESLPENPFALYIELLGGWD